MKIISKFKDYYDSVSHQYLDKDIVYNRDFSHFDIDEKDLPKVKGFFVEGSGVKYSIDLEIIGFCGNLIPVITVAEDSPEMKENTYKKSMYGFYNVDDFIDFAISRGIQVGQGKKYRRKYRYWFSYDLNKTDLEDFFENRENYSKLEPLFLKHNTPVFSYRYGYNSKIVFINPMLKNYSFAKYKDPYSAHQDIYQFVSGHLKQPEREMVEISNQDKIDKHGFDKWSFRKLPSKK